MCKKGSKTIPPFKISPDPSESLALACGLSSSAHPTGFQWGGLGWPLQKLYSVVSELLSVNLSCSFLERLMDRRLAQKGFNN